MKSTRKGKIRVIILLVFTVLFCCSLFLNIYFIKSSRGVTKYNIAATEKILGLEFTSKERKLMFSNVKKNLSKYEKLRDVSLDNGVIPAIVFNPVLPDKKIKIEEKMFSVSSVPNISVPENQDELAYYPIPLLAHLVRTRQITSTQLTEFFLNRLKKYADTLKCVITLTENLALEQARQADQEIASGNYRGLLHGIPWGAKDLLAAKGIKTTWGAKPFKEQVINKDATVVKKLKAAGAVLVAKLTLGALAMGDVWYGGKTRNPWDTSKGSSGSSAGPAAAVAAGLVPFAIGSETWGSIVSPCTVCGVTGLRPTFGRVSRTGAMALSWTMDKIGPICRNSEDCAIVLNAICGPDGEDPTVQDLPFNYNTKIRFSDLTIGYVKNDLESDYRFKETDSLTIEKLRELGAKLVPINLPDVPVNDISFILSAEAGAAFDELTRSGKDDLLVRQGENAWPNSFRTSRLIPAVEYINANRTRSLLMQKMEKLMDEIDLYVAPSWKGKNLLLTNLTGHPCVVLPNGFSEKGMPRSICFIGKLFDEGTILAVAQTYQNATDFHLKHPKL